MQSLRRHKQLMQHPNGTKAFFLLSQFSDTFLCFRAVLVISFMIRQHQGNNRTVTFALKFTNKFTFCNCIESICICATCNSVKDLIPAII